MCGCEPRSRKAVARRERRDADIAKRLQTKVNSDQAARPPFLRTAAAQLTARFSSRDMPDHRPISSSDRPQPVQRSPCNDIRQIFRQGDCRSSAASANMRAALPRVREAPQALDQHRELAPHKSEEVLDLRIG